MVLSYGLARTINNFAIITSMLWRYGVYVYRLPSTVIFISMEIGKIYIFSANKCLVLLCCHYCSAHRFQYRRRRHRCRHRRWGAELGSRTYFIAHALNIRKVVSLAQHPPQSPKHTHSIQPESSKLTLATCSRSPKSIEDFPTTNIMLINDKIIDWVSPSSGLARECRRTRYCECSSCLASLVLCRSQALNDICLTVFGFPL